MLHCVCGQILLNLSRSKCSRCVRKEQEREIDQMRGQQRRLAVKMQQLCHIVLSNNFTALDVHALGKLSEEWTDLDKRAYEAKRHL
jgi:hypothetical protein